MRVEINIIGFCSMKQIEVFLPTLDGMLHHRITQHLVSWCLFIHLGGKGTVGERCLAQQHDTMFQGRN